MDRKEFSSKTIKTAGTTGVIIVRTFQHPDYNLIPFSDAQATDTGLVKIASLVPRVAGSTLPEFRFRWDDAGNELDVDIYVGGENRKDLWEEDGYIGHKTILVDAESRKYSADISTPVGNVFRGTVQVGLLTALQLGDGITVMDASPILKIIGP